MATRTQIEARIKSLDPVKFQEFCDELIRREEKGVLVSFGKQDARNKTTKGSAPCGTGTRSGFGTCFRPGSPLKGAGSPPTDNI